MGTKNCTSCGKASHTEADHCLYCGSVKFKTVDFIDSAWLIFAVLSILVLLTFFYGHKVLNQLNVGVISARDFQNCTNDRIMITMKNTFNNSKYAIQNKVIVKEMSAKSYVHRNKEAIIACEVDFILSNDTTKTYVYQVKYIEGEYMFATASE